MKAKIEKRRSALYAAVKAQRPDLYQSAIYVAEIAACKHGVSLACAADIETAAMDLAASAAGISVGVPA
jgi:hypothetical protein